MEDIIESRINRPVSQNLKYKVSNSSYKGRSIFTEIYRLFKKLQADFYWFKNILNMSSKKYKISTKHIVRSEILKLFPNEDKFDIFF